MSAAKKTKKKKLALKKAVPATTSMAAPPHPPPINFPLNDVPLVILPTPLPSRDQTIEGSGDLSDVVIFTRSIVSLAEQLMGLDKS